MLQDVWTKVLRDIRKLKDRGPLRISLANSVSVGFSNLIGSPPRCFFKTIKLRRF
jgi:hypothetical protein